MRQPWRLWVILLDAVQCSKGFVILSLLKQLPGLFEFGAQRVRRRFGKGSGAGCGASTDGGAWLGCVDCAAVPVGEGQHTCQKRTDPHEFSHLKIPENDERTIRA